MKLLAIDGNSIVNRAFYGIKLLTTKNGQYTNAIYGFINILNSLIERENPDGVAIAFDLKAPTFRHNMYDEYKAGRKPMPSELASQIPVLKELLSLMGYVCVEAKGYEADDILGTLSLVAENTADECVISTGDRDSLQLVSQHTRVLLASTKMGRPEITDFTPQTIFEKYGLTPGEMIELKALMGDQSDHIPGVAGVGEKTATDLIKNYHSIEYIYENINQLEIKDGVRNKLILGKESAFLSKKLGTIFREVPIDKNFENYRFKETDKPALAAFLRKLEFFKLIEKMGLQNLGESDLCSERKEPKSYKTVNFEKFYSLVNTSKTASVAIYGDCLYFACENSVIGISTQNAEQIKAVFGVKNLKVNAADSKNLYTAVSNILDLNTVDFDLSLAGYLCSPNANSYDVSRLAEEYLSTAVSVEDEAEGYKIAASANELWPIMEKQIKEYDMEMLLRDIELPLAKLLSEMEREGFLLDTEGIAEMGKNLEGRISNLEEDIYSLAGESFNIKSPQQLGVILFEKLGLSHGKKTKTGYSTTAEFLEKI